MRRLFTGLLALGLVGTVLGCHHTAGVCDCDICNDPCCYYYGCGCNNGVVSEHEHDYDPGIHVSGAPVSRGSERLGMPMEKAKE